MSQPTASDSSKRIGQGMWILFWILLLLAFGWFFGRAEEQQQYPNQHVAGQVTDSARELILDANRAGHYTLPGSINGKPVRFLLDTGASDVVIPGDIADSLGLQPGRSLFANTANGTIRINQTRIDELAIGPIRLRNIRAAINPHMQGDILLGMSALKSLEMIHRNDQLLIRQSLY